MTKWMLLGALAAVELRVLVASANVQPAPVDDECVCDPPVPGEVKQLRTKVRILEAEARVNVGIHAKTMKKLEALKGCLDLVDQTKLADCKIFLR